MFEFTLQANVKDAGLVEYFDKVNDKTFQVPILSKIDTC
jgi:hypothetical protein